MKGGVIEETDKENSKGRQKSECIKHMADEADSFFKPIYR